MKKHLSDMTFDLADQKETSKKARIHAHKAKMNETSSDMRSTRVSLQVVSGQPILPNDLSKLKGVLFEEEDNKNQTNQSSLLHNIYKRNARLIRPKVGVGYVNEWNNLGNLSKKYCQLLMPEKVMRNMENSCIEKALRFSARSEGATGDIQNVLQRMKTKSVDNGRSLNRSTRWETVEKVRGIEEPKFLKKDSENDSLGHEKESGEVMMNLDGSIDLPMRDERRRVILSKSEETEDLYERILDEGKIDNFRSMSVNSEEKKDIQKDFKINKNQTLRHGRNSILKPKQTSNGLSNNSLTTSGIQETKNRKKISIMENTRSASIQREKQGGITPIKDDSFHIELIEQLGSTYLKNFMIGQIDPLNEVNFETSEYLKYLRDNSSLIKSHFSKLLQTRKGRKGELDKSIIKGKSLDFKDKRNAKGALLPKVILFKKSLYEQPKKDHNEGEFKENQSRMNKDMCDVEEKVEFNLAMDDCATAFSGKKYFDTYMNKCGAAQMNMGEVKKVVDKGLPANRGNSPCISKSGFESFSDYPNYSTHMAAGGTQGMSILRDDIVMERIMDTEGSPFNQQKDNVFSSKKD